MLSFLGEQFLFILSIILLLFVPGYFFLLLVTKKDHAFSWLEKFVISFGLSLTLVNFMMIILGKIGAPLNKIYALMVIVALLPLLYFIKIKFGAKSHPTSSSEPDEKFSRNQTILIILILFLTIFIKTIYLTGSIFPTSTDLGHHMYWSKIISETGQLPFYAESDIIKNNGTFAVSAPQSIADFIIGEHLIFSAIHTLSGANFISAFPSLILFLANILSILAVFILTLRLFADSTSLDAKNIAILVLFLLGPLYAISSSQIKFASGGVVGNVFGNYFIPLIFYFFLRALTEKKALFLALALLLFGGLLYTHHLSSFIFLYASVFAILLFGFFNFHNLKNHLLDWWKLLRSPAVLAVIIFLVGFLFFLYAPSYLSRSAVATATGAPLKETRTGVTFSQLKFTAGEMRLALGLLGLAILFFWRNRHSYSSTILAGWTLAILLMSLKPQWLYVNILSSRIANYAAYPLAITAALALAWSFRQIQAAEKKKYLLNTKILHTAYFLLFAAMAMGGFYDNSQSLSINSNFAKAVQIFHSADFLAGKIDAQDIVLKDHNYLTADAWIKLSFLRGYNFPFSRGFFKRYEDEAKPREMCTLWMISTPSTSEGEKCFADTGVNFTMVNPTFDGAQFERSKNFWKIYAGDEVAIFYRTKK